MRSVILAASLALVTVAWGQLPVEPLVDVPRPTAWPSELMQAAPYPVPDLPKADFFWSVWWAANERCLALSRWHSWDQLQAVGPGDFTLTGQTANWLEWPVKPMVIYWNAAVATGVETVEVVDAFFGWTNTWTITKWTNQPCVISPVPNDRLWPTTVVLEVSSGGSPINTRDTGDPAYGQVPTYDYPQDAFMGLDWNTSRFTQVSFTAQQHNVIMNRMEALGLGWFAGMGNQVTWPTLDQTIQHLATNYVDHWKAPDLAAWFNTSTGTWWSWMQDRDQDWWLTDPCDDTSWDLDGGPDVSMWKDHGGSYPTAPPMLTVDLIASNLTAAGIPVGGFVEHPRWESNNVTSVKGWAASPQVLTQYEVAGPGWVEWLDPHASFRFTLQPTNFWAPIHLAQVVIRQTNITAVDVRGFTREHGGILEDWGGIYTHSGFLNGRSICTGSRGAFYWDGGRWCLGPDTATAYWASLTADDILGRGTQWAKLNVTGSVGYVNRQTVQVGGIFQDDLAMPEDCVRHQDYAPMVCRIFQNDRTNPVTCSLAVSGVVCGISARGEWFTTTKVETVSLAGKWTNDAAQTVSSFFDITSVDLTGWEYTLTNNVLPTNYVNGITIQLAWEKSTKLFCPAWTEQTPDHDARGFIRSLHGGPQWVGLWERAQVLNQMRQTWDRPRIRPLDLSPWDKAAWFTGGSSVVTDGIVRVSHYVDLTSHSATLCDIWEGVAIGDSQLGFTNYALVTEWPAFSWQADKYCADEVPATFSNPWEHYVNGHWRTYKPAREAWMVNEDLTTDLGATAKGFMSWLPQGDEIPGDWTWWAQQICPQACDASAPQNVYVDDQTWDDFPGTFGAEPWKVASVGTATKAAATTSVKWNVDKRGSFQPDPAVDASPIYDVTVTGTCDGTPPFSRTRHVAEWAKQSPEWKPAVKGVLMTWDFTYLSP